MPPNEDNWYIKRGLTPPSHQSHGLTPDDIRVRLKPLKPHSWKLQGNRLIAKTDFGDLVNFIPTDYILSGTDKDGLPIFKKLVI